MAKYVIDISEEVTNYRLWLENLDTEIGTQVNATPLEEYCDSCPYQPIESEDD